MIMTTLVHDSDYVLAINEYADISTRNENETTHEIWIEESDWSYAN